LLLGVDLIILREHGAEHRIDNAEHRGVGEGLDPERLSGRESQEKARGQKHKKKHGDEDVGVHGLSYPLYIFSLSKVILARFMVKPVHFHTLALRAVQTNRSVLAHLTRIQSGFLPEVNIQQAEESLAQLQSMLHEMKSALHSPPPKEHSSFVPLK
jgi:hypothetical protein